MGDDQGLPHMKRLLPLLPSGPGGVRSLSIAQTLTIINIPGLKLRPRDEMAEREGFEPSVPCDTHEFQSCTFGLSVTSPSNEPGGEGGIRTLGSVNYT